MTVSNLLIRGPPIKGMQEELVWVADSQIDLGSGVEPENFLLKKIMKLCDLQLEALG